MKKLNKILTLLALFIFIFINFNKTFAATATPSVYKTQVYSLWLCENGSTISSCDPKVNLNTVTSPTIMDIGSVEAGAAAGSFGNISKATIGKTYTFGMVIIDRAFIMAGTDGSCETSGGAPGIENKFAVGSVGSAGNTEQIIFVPNQTGAASYQNSTTASDGTGTASAAGVVASGEQFMEFRWELATPFTMTNEMPTMKIAFDVTNAITFNGTCGGAYGASHGVTPEAPTITNTFQ